MTWLRIKRMLWYWNRYDHRKGWPHRCWACGRVGDIHP